MDLNQLYFDHQLQLMEAERAGTVGRRQAHEVAASHIAYRIGGMQRALGAPAARSWDALAAFGEGSLASPKRHLREYAS